MTRRRAKQPKFIVVNDRKPVWKPSLKIAIIYALIGFCWIFFSDNLAEFLVKDRHILLQLNVFKGSVYVILSAFIIYFLISRAFAKLSDNEQVINENQRELKALLYYDHLTGLFNRRKLIERLPDYLHDGTTQGKALLYLDIDNIKLINDTMGHLTGDGLIATTAKKLSSILSAPEEVYRLGGDEFIILMKFANVLDVERKAETLLSLFDAPVSVDGALIHTTVSVGIALYPRHCEEPGELLKFADVAMYRSKRNGKNQAIIYDPNMMNEINERMSIGEYLHDALERNELEVFYQPQLCVNSRQIEGFEALLRWNNHFLGKVSPDKFISVAEETHLIIPIGEWILRESCAFLKKMHDAGFVDLSVSVNISMIQLLQDDFVDSIMLAIEETNINPEKLKLEITESILMESWTMIRAKLERLRGKGVGIALDDFGKGYSSLSYLERLPITILKIDKIFVDGIHETNNDATLMGNIVQIGKKLGLQVIAEGVETAAQMRYLSAQNCDSIQGWFYSKALCKAEAEKLARENLSKD